MAKNHKQKKTGGEVPRDTKEITQIEQYWHVLGRAKLRKPPKDYNYVEELAHLQLELIKLQEWVRMRGVRLSVILRGSRRGRKGWRDQAHYPEPQSARLPRGGFGHGYRKGTRPVVFPALCGRIAFTRRDRALRQGVGTTAPASSE
jgi:hypothetical protein